MTGRRFSFYLLDYDLQQLQNLRRFLYESAHVCYAIFRRKIQTKEEFSYLQGYVVFRNPQRLSEAQRLFPIQAYVEVAKNTSRNIIPRLARQGHFEEFNSGNKFYSKLSWSFHSHPISNQKKRELEDA